MPRFRKSFFFSVLVFLGVVWFSQLGRGVSFTRHIYPGKGILAHADLNSDGREGVIYGDAQNAGGFFVKLSIGDGVYGTATHYALPAGFLGTIGIGDFSGDGKPDLAGLKPKSRFPTVPAEVLLSPLTSTAMESMIWWCPNPIVATLL